MESDGPFEGPTHLREQAKGAGGEIVATADGDASSERLLDLEGEWEDRQLGQEGDHLGPSHIDDPSLVETLRKRINQRKRLYAFLGISSDQIAEPQAAESARAAVQLGEPPISTIPGLRGEEQPVPAEAPAYPHFGRYEVLEIAGSGAFGVIYKALDAGLDRLVAIKMPKFETARQFDADAYQKEARIVAGLSHPNIVPIYDVGHTDDGRCYIVSRYIDGGNLAIALKKERPSFSRSVELIAIICDALYYAHTRDVFHRDIKPANILIDAAGVPFLADFGLALKDEDFGTGPHHLGTPAFMSPEQARGEGHLVDGRSDIFSLGVVFYIMLTGRRPFRGATRHQVIHQIINSEPRPPRQIDSDVPKELERICLKAIAKRASERYLVARDMEDDLREYQRSPSSAHPSPDWSQRLRTSRTTEAHEAAAHARSESSEHSFQAIKIVPKGLCSFDEHDAEFFLELLPGPRDRYGLPDSLRFWKTKILATDPDKTFRVGLVYGPSGCGKSSLIKAGLLPQLKEAGVKSVYVEASANDTEAHLARNLRREIAGLPGDLGLVHSLALLRQNRSHQPASKVILILDQFEQWLFARGNEPQETELVGALRQCDGVRVQALCLLRDDFWMAATRFMRDLDIKLVPSENVAAVDLFDMKHARKVLGAYGRAYEALPSHERELTKEQRGFLDRAIAGLAQDGRVVPVRLALFAEMVKNKPWTTSTLAEVGGMEGVGTKFLDDSFTSQRSNPVHRYHAAAAKSVLESLLPETNADIKGRMRSLAELRGVSGYASRPSDFAELLQVLDRNLRLVTPVDVENSIDDDTPKSSTSDRYYQLTHDYLVHSVRDWLNKDKLTTARGRAQLLLADRAGLWNSKQVNRHLPSLREWLTIRLLVGRSKWTERQQRMMKRAGRVHGTRLIGLLGALCFFSIGLIAYSVYSASHALVEKLSAANVDRIPDILEQLSRYPRWVFSRRLRELASHSEKDPRSRLGYSLALLPGDAGQVEYLYRRLLTADAGEMAVIRDGLAPHRNALIERLWRVLNEASVEDARLLPAAGGVARYDPTNPTWSELGSKVAGAIVLAKLDDASRWRDALREVRHALVEPLAKIFRKNGGGNDEHMIATTTLAHYAADKPSLLVELLVDSDATTFPVLFHAVEQDTSAVLESLRNVVSLPGADSTPGSPAGDSDAGDKRSFQARENDEIAKDELAERRARAAVALVRLGRAGEVWQLLEHGPEPRCRSAFIHLLSRLGADPLSLARELGGQGKSGDEPRDLAEPVGVKNACLFDPALSKRRGLILALAEYPKETLAPRDRNDLVSILIDLYRNDPDAGVHSVSELVLRRWGQEGSLKLEPERPAGFVPGGRRWYVSPAGQIMVLVDGPVEFDMGAPRSDPDWQQEEMLHRVRIPRRFAIASKEVTVEQFQLYAKENRGSEHKFTQRYSPDGRGPQISVSWFDAAAYCNWLSDKEGLPHCYEPNSGGDFAAEMRVVAGAALKGGYRLPTEAEWEYACRAGASTARYYGHSPLLLKFYEWYVVTSESNARVCGMLLPNDFGLFDMLGNVAEWCHDRQVKSRPRENGIEEDIIENEKVGGDQRYFRGERFNSGQSGLRCATRIWFSPVEWRVDLGFRPARTIP